MLRDPLIWQFFRTIPGAIVGLVLVFDSLLRAGLLALRSLLPTKSIPRGNSSSSLVSGTGAVLLIAAHNEQGTIGPTVAALCERAAEWPGSQVWVVADRCTDETAREAVAAGARVAVRSDGRLGKCAVLDWWLTTHAEVWRGQDGILVLDADSRLAAGSLRALRTALSKGWAAAQAFVAPVSDRATGRMAGWSEVLMQRIDDEARRRCGWSVPLRGTGMLFRGDLLAELTPGLHTLAEDLEMDVLLAARGVRVGFVPEAVVWDPKPPQAEGASRQRARWLQGQGQVLRGYARPLARALFAGGPGAWALLPLLLMRPKVAFIGLRLLGLGLASLLPPPLCGPLGGLLFLGLALDGMYYLAGAFVVDDPRRYLLDLLTVPRYLMMWLHGVALSISRRGQKIWLRAGR